MYWTVLCYHPYLVSLLFADLLSLHLVTFLMFLILVRNTYIIHFFMQTSSKVIVMMLGILRWRRMKYMVSYHSSRLQGILHTAGGTQIKTDIKHELIELYVCVCTAWHCSICYLQYYIVTESEPGLYKQLFPKHLCCYKWIELFTNSSPACLLGFPILFSISTTVEPLLKDSPN